jgi:hypothetical protein
MRCAENKGLALLLGPRQPLIGIHEWVMLMKK